MKPAERHRRLTRVTPRLRTHLLFAIAACSSAPARPVFAQSPPLFTAADVQFMTGMIAHHAQAVLMAGWAPTHGASPAVRDRKSVV